MPRSVCSRDDHFRDDQRVLIRIEGYLTITDHTGIHPVLNPAQGVRLSVLGVFFAIKFESAQTQTLL